MNINIDKELLMKVALYAIVINLVIPHVLKPFASQDEIKPPNGAANLSFKGQLMHMFVHHAQVPVSSSIIVAIIMSLALVLAQNY